MVDGNELTVYFSTANTQYSSSVQLNINNKGAKDVWVANAVTSPSNQLLWGAGAYITFKYVTVGSNSYFIVIGEPRSWYGASTTAANTEAKIDTTAVTGCVICKGAKIELAMSNKNTNDSATLNIRSTGYKAIYYGNTSTRPTVDNGHSWIDSTTATFTFDGSAYRMAGQTVINGDSITTGTIDANRIAAGSLTIGKVSGLQDSLDSKPSISDAQGYASDAAQEAKDYAYDQVSEVAGDLSDLNSDLTTYKTTVSNTYAAKDKAVAQQQRIYCRFTSTQSSL